MTAFDYDLITIGAGSGGVRASRIAAGHGARVAVIEEDRPGGTCVLRGCVPKKLLVYGAQFAADAEDAIGFGWDDIKPNHDWGRLMEAKTAELDRLAGIYMKLLNDAGVEVMTGRGMITGPNSVRVDDGREITAEHILVAVGGWPSIPPIPGLAEHGISSNEALGLANRPDEVVIFGAGYIAVEFAGIFNGFGAKTHLVYRADLPLRGFDDDMRRGLADAMTGRGIILHPGNVIEKVSGDDGKKTIALSGGESLSADTLMVATGRRPMTGNLGLENAGVEVDERGSIPVDGASRTATPSIYAIGDVTARVSLTPVAIAEGHAFADSVFGNAPSEISHKNIPSAVFSQPPIASVGLTEDGAKAAGIEVEVYISRFNAMKNTISGREEKSVMKLLVDAKTGKVIGAHMLGADAPEIIQGLAVAITAGASKADFDATMGIHPTAAEEFVTMQTPRRTPNA